MSGFYFQRSNATPATAVVGGTDDDGSTIYVGRAQHDGKFIPAKIVPSRRVAYVAFGGKEHEKRTYEFLCERSLKWISCNGRNIPSNAVKGGNNNDGETLYIGRAPHGRGKAVGKVHPSHGCLYIPYGGHEIRKDHFEILVEM